MDLSIVSNTSPEEAKEKYVAYRTAARANHDPEDEALMRCYREAALGNRILDLRQTLSAGGVDDEGFPRLAVMRADFRWCWLYRRAQSGAVTYCCERNPHHARRQGIYAFPDGTLPEAGAGQATFTTARPGYRAMVPIIPPHLRPRYHLHNYEILWEVDKWERLPLPPEDPALLRHVYGWLYVVVATWDLTPLEQAVLGSRTD